VLRIAHTFAEDVLQPESADEDGVPLLEPHAAVDTGRSRDCSSSPLA
jgi:hypothetical protein